MVLVPSFLTVMLRRCGYSVPRPWVQNLSDGVDCIGSGGEVVLGLVGGNTFGGTVECLTRASP